MSQFWSRKGRTDPETSWIEDDHEPATVPHQRPAAPEPDDHPTVLSASHDSEPALLVDDVPSEPFHALPVGLRPNPRVNRQSPSVDSPPEILTTPRPDVDDPRVLDLLRSIDRSTHDTAEAAKVSATADARATAVLERGASWVWTVFLFACATAAMALFLAMATTCAFLLLRGAP